MGSLLPVLASIALLDSLSMVPLCALPLSTMLGGPRPWAGASGFIGGIVSVYFAAGVGLLAGARVLLDRLNPVLERLWTDPYTLEIWIQVVLGAAMIGFGWKLGEARKGPRDEEPAAECSPATAFALGAGITVVGVPGAFPYFGAVDQILQADVQGVGAAGALLFYCVIFVLPLLMLCAVRVITPAQSEAIFGRVASLADRWGRKLGVGVLILVGLVLFADGVGWLLGHPLFPPPV